MTDTEQVKKPHAVMQLKRLVTTTKNSYMIQYRVRTYVGTLEFIEGICREFNTTTVACCAPRKLVDDMLPRVTGLAKKQDHGTVPFVRFMAFTGISAISAGLQNHPMPAIVIVFGPFIGEHKEVYEKLQKNLRSHVIRVVIYLAYINAPYNKVIVV